MTAEATPTALIAGQTLITTDAVNALRDLGLRRPPT